MEGLAPWVQGMQATGGAGAVVGVTLAGQTWDGTTGGLPTGSVRREDAIIAGPGACPAG